VDANATCLELRTCLRGERVVSERGEEHRLAGEARELDGRHRPSSARLLPALERVHDVARRRDALDTHELDPFDVADDRDLHLAAPTKAAAASGT
jgi:hypothetical protein